jgi:hypothetical protein
MTLCGNCLKIPHITSADFGGSFVCVICKLKVNNVASLGCGKVCSDCQIKGYCKYCAMFITKEENKK